VRGYSESYGVNNLLRVPLDSSPPTAVIQFVSTNKTFQEDLKHHIKLILESKLISPCLAIFGWSNSSAKVRDLIPSKDPPKHTISLRHEFDDADISDFLLNLLSNLYLGLETAVQAAAFSVKIYDNIDRVIDCKAPTEFSSEPVSETINVKGSETMIASLEYNHKPDFSPIQLQAYPQTLQGMRRGCLILIFAFNDEETMKQFERDFGVILNRGPEVRANGSLDIAQSEITSLSFRTCNKKVLTEKWMMVSDSKWEWEQLLELFELPGVKFIRNFVNDKTIEFEGTLYAKGVMESNSRYGSMVETQNFWGDVSRFQCDFNLIYSPLTRELHLGYSGIHTPVAFFPANGFL